MKKAHPFKEFSGAKGLPTKAEASLIESCISGEFADFEAFIEKDRKVSTSLVEAILTGTFQHPSYPDFKLHSTGVKMGHAILSDCLSLDNRSIICGLWLVECQLHNGFDFDSAVITGDVFFKGCNFYGVNYLCDAIIHGQFQAVECEFLIHKNEALKSDVSIVGYGMRATAFVVNQSKFEGQLDLLNANFIGQFSGNQSTFSNPNGEALSCDNLVASGISLDGAVINGVLTFQEAKVSGQFVASNTAFTSAVGVNIAANGAHVDAFNINGSTFSGLLDLVGVRITGQFQANGTTFENINNDVIKADYAIVKGGIFFKPLNGKPVTAHGAILLNFAHIDKILDFTGSILSANEYMALGLRGAVISGEVRLCSMQIKGHVNAEAVNINGRISFKDTAVKSSRSCNIKVTKTDSVNKQLREAFKDYAIVLREANIKGRLVMPDIRCEGIVDLSRLRCDLFEDFKTGWAPVLCAGQQFCEGQSKESPPNHHVLYGLEYNYLEHPSGIVGDGKKIAKNRTDWLCSQGYKDINLHFNPQPWQQLSQTLHSMGYENDSQDIIISGRIRRRKAKDTPFMQKTMNFILHVLAKYGYSPMRTVIISLFVMVFCALCFEGGEYLCNQQQLNVSCSNSDLFIKASFRSFAEAEVVSVYPLFNPILYSVDIFIPFLDFSEEAYWIPNTRVILEIASNSQLAFLNGFPIGLAFKVFIIVERIIGAILMAITITGFTGILSRTQS